MANWITLKQLSEKRGIAESDLRIWANLGYIASSRIENVLMIDDESLTQYLDVHQTKDLGENYLEKIIKEKELEREVLLSQCDDELFLLKTQKLHQPLFHILIQELGQLITDDHEREIFLSVSGGEPIARVAKRNKMTYARVATCYSSILRTLGEHKGRIATFRSRTMELMFDKCNAVTPVNTPYQTLSARMPIMFYHCPQRRKHRAVTRDRCTGNIKKIEPSIPKGIETDTKYPFIKMIIQTLQIRFFPYKVPRMG
ncbi:DNA-binding protein [Bacteroides fragilis]|nr:DNA-binding protein [Bacteroides fragilis]